MAEKQNRGMGMTIRRAAKRYFLAAMLGLTGQQVDC
jgi:hypothetical protein